MNVSLDIPEIKQAIAILKKYNVSVNADEDFTVEGLDSDTFLALPYDYFKFAAFPYCANEDYYFCFNACKECSYRKIMQPYIKRFDGVQFTCNIPQNEKLEKKLRELMM